MTATIANYLSDQDFFKELPREYIEFLASKSAWQQFAKDTVLFRIADPASSFYVVGSGTVHLEIPAISGPTLEVQHLGADQILGWSWLIPPYRWNFNARAETDCELLVIDGSSVLERCEQDAEFGYQLLKRFSALMSERLNVARQKMIDQWDPPGFA
ncbi:cyclic nucleotide-binding domain-containing protein [Halorhodospira halochloris]|uniref:cAMP-binding proteins-catabolite gene activator and regulatory subunit of cAMP-dependent protein kinases n=1 Tax=Halorhodospira halochloris TaxID=1052 RepID=A0A0X8XA13_HALHR|nr:cyclic nucleotide-binding domain-containing protein [Halorhodospira halochloris]MBK1651959.1 regulator [Halorhodospira halochloris]MCG5530340.1 cyclic nucleotide-binding domain-containing protein [Halorhodospira halochloris]MCG5547932.1 cyclic nucleotide-binding domain-containing protein [Halorhodospira halochloris]BAU58251.2 cAMP-binding proteins - catabolite gene activator and regulatory subunit of cAMP-dependent protein kinases [Halorhodospira halochloris]